MDGESEAGAHTDPERAEPPTDDHDPPAAPEPAPREAEPTDRALAELFEDAILVASFGRRAGKFPDNVLFGAIQTAKATPGLGWGSREVADLQDALNKAIRVLHPVTLFDLRNGWNPFRASRGGRSKTSWLMVSFIVIASVLLLACGYYTIWYKRSAALLESIADAKIAKQTEIINDIINTMVSAKGQSPFAYTINPGDATYDSIRKKILEVREIDRKIIEDRMIYSNQRKMLIPTTTIYYEIIGWRNSVNSAAVAPASVGQAGANKATTSAAPPREWRQVGCEGGTSLSRLFPAIELQDPSARVWFAIAAFRDFVQGDDNRFDRVRCALGVSTTSNAGSFDGVTRYLRENMELLGTWLLPAMYGALGALMFHMRAFIDPLIPNPRPERVLLRVALGIFAGVSVAWFLTPTVADGINGVGLGVLTVAFLLGFSIDVFFALLDRLVTLARNGITNLGGA